MAEETAETPGPESVPPPGAEPPEFEATPDPAPDPNTPQDTDDTRGFHLRRLVRSPWTIGLTAFLVIAGFVGGTVGAGAAIGAAVAGGVLLLAALTVFVMASGRAEEDFFAAYADGRGLNRQSGRGSLPPSTPLLRKGDERYAEQVMHGTLPSGVPGALALYTYEEHRRDSEGRREVDHYRFTVVMHDMPAVAQRVADVYVQRRSGFRWMDSAEDVFRRMKRLELESEALDKRYEIFYGADDDEVWLKRVFSPKFIVWLSETAPDGLAFECSGGSLCVNQKGHHDNAVELDHLCVAAGDIAQRLAGEAAETSLPRG